jgi:hypothetical protein
MRRAKQTTRATKRDSETMREREKKKMRGTEKEKRTTR